MRAFSVSERMGLVKELIRGRRRMQQMPTWSSGQIRDWQFEKIKELVAHAVEHVPFYKTCYGEVGFEPGDLKTWEDFQALPLLQKQDVIDHYPQDMVDHRYDEDERIVSRSSGSSGQVLDICYDRKAMMTYALAGLRLYQMGFDYKPWHHQLYVYTSSYPFSSVFGMYPMHFVSTLDPVDSIITRMESVRPHLLVCYPSHLKQLAPLVTERAGSRLQCVSVNSEMSSQAERDHLSDQLGCPVLDEYSSEELTRIAAQCSCGTYHVFDDINYMENIPGEGGSGNLLVGTNLHNRAMPMIRYQQNDMGTICETRCKCGWGFRELVGLQGRKNDSFLLPSGREISSGFLLDATYDLLLEWRESIKDFCLIQSAADTVELQVVKGAGWSDELRSEIIQRFTGYFGGEVQMSVKEVADCPKTASGKRNPIRRLF